MVFRGMTRKTADAQGLCPGTLPRDFALGISRNIPYIVYNIVFDIINNMLCTCNTTSSIPLGGNEILSCSTKIGAVSSVTDPEAVCTLGWSGGNACGQQPQLFFRVQEHHKYRISDTVLLVARLKTGMKLLLSERHSSFACAVGS